MVWYGKCFVLLIGPYLVPCVYDGGGGGSGGDLHREEWKAGWMEIALLLEPLHARLYVLSFVSRANCYSGPGFPFCPMHVGIFDGVSCEAEAALGDCFFSPKSFFGGGDPDGVEALFFLFFFGSV